MNDSCRTTRTALESTIIILLMADANAMVQDTVTSSSLLWFDRLKLKPQIPKKHKQRRSFQVAMVCIDKRKSFDQLTEKLFPVMNHFFCDVPIFLFIVKVNISKELDLTLPSGTLVLPNSVANCQIQWCDVWSEATENFPGSEVDRRGFREKKKRTLLVSIRLEATAVVNFYARLAGTAFLKGLQVMVRSYA